MEPKTGATLVGIFSGVNAVSRILLGLAADKFGRFRVLFLCTATGGLSCYALWLNTKGLTMAVIFVIVYGINGGGFVSLFPVVAAEIIGVEKLSLAVGLLYSGNLFGKLTDFTVDPVGMGWHRILSNLRFFHENREPVWDAYRICDCNSVSWVVYVGHHLCRHNTDPGCITAASALLRI
jgi:MFS family permease